MPDQGNSELCAAAFARIEEIKSVRYVRADHNLTEGERGLAQEADRRAYRYFNMRLRGSSNIPTNWLEDLGSKYAYAWAMSPDMDPFGDLLVPNGYRSTAYRPRLPGVTVHDVERRIQFLADAVAAHIAQIKAQEAGRGRAR